MRTMVVVAKLTVAEAVKGKVLWLVVFFAVAIGLLTGVLAESLHSDQLSTYYKLLVDGGLTPLSLGLLIIALFFTQQTMLSDRANKTSLLALAMPIKRWQYLLGKYMGVCAVLALSGAMFLGILHGMMHYLIHTEAGEARGHIAPWLPWLAWATLGFILSAWIQAAWILLLSITIGSEFLILILAIGIWAIGTWSLDVMNLASHAAGLIPGLTNAIFYVLPDYTSLNFLPAAAYQEFIPMSQVINTLGYSLGYIAVMLLLIVRIYERIDLS